MPSAPNSPRWRIQAALHPLALFAVRLLLILTAARILLVAWQAERVLAVDMLVTIFVQGLRFDLVLLGIALVIPVLAFPLFASTGRLVRIWQLLLRFYLPAVLLFVLFMEISTPSFMQQFDSRPNILFIEYLGHPKEVLATLWAAYKLPLVIAFVLLPAIALVLTREFRSVAQRVQATGVLPALLLFPLLLIVCTGFIRSTLDHRPVNPSTVALSTDPLVNDLALNSTYTLLYAIYETRHEGQGGFRYADIPESHVIQSVRDEMQVAPEDFTSEVLPTLHTHQGTATSGRQKNLVIVIEESLGAEFVGALGGLPLTPNLDALSREGIWLTNLYATGTRSVRGLEAIVSGYTPTPARSVVKLPKSQRGFFTLAELLGSEGYETSFIYGGEAQFDNMRRFFVNNGFGHVIDEKDYIDPVFVGSWGVSDEDLFARANDEFERAGEVPFFSVVFTSSNHSPYQFPDGRIELFDPDKNTVNNAVRYADHALGEFFRKAKQSSYWDDTVFLVVADHNSRVYGDQVIPVDRFQVPGLILGGSIEAGSIDTVASQIDLGPTLLSLIDYHGEHPMIGRDLIASAHTGKPGRAIMQFNTTQAYMEGDQVIVMQRDQPPKQFRYVDRRLEPAEDVDAGLKEKALAHSVWSSLAYEQSLYRLGAKDFRVAGL
jgi:phosphoglycerol transferase MdoB-like AlkP superfamily enzyme